MAKLTRQQKNVIRMSLIDLNRARAYILDPRHHILVERQIAVFPAQAWINEEGVHAISINKEIGSDLTGLYQAIRKLEQMLGPEDEK